MKRHAKAIVAGLAVLLTIALGATLANAVAPVVTIENAFEVGASTAKVKGEVDSQEQPTSWRFQYITDAQYEENINVNLLPGFEGATDGPSGFLESGADTITRKLTGLTPSTTYHLRLLADNGDPAGPSEAVAANTFTTEGVTAPQVTADEASEVAYTTAKATGTVKAGGADPAFNSPCRFDYIADAQYDENIANSLDGFEGAPAVGCDVEPTGAGGTEVKADLTGLSHSTTYHLRLVASNAGGTGSDEAPSTFTTLTVVAPEVTVPVVSAITATTAHFSGEVAPNAPGPEPQDPAFDADWSFSCDDPGCPAGPKGGTVAADNAAHQVEDDVTDLEPSTEYTVTLKAGNLGGEDSKQFTFTTDEAGPSVETKAASSPSPTEAELHGIVNPHNSPTVYWFEWGAGDCASNPCTAVPATKDADAGSGGLNQFVVDSIAGLEEGVTYHYRLVADNGTGGPVAGEDSTFTTTPNPVCGNEAIRAEQHSTFLPDCRAYELVSPPDKNGGDVMGDSARTRAADDGSAVQFSSLTAFGDTQGTGVAADYMARRTAAPGTSGWATHAITPRQPSLSFGSIGAEREPLYVGDFSGDLSRGVFRSGLPMPGVPAAPNVAEAPNNFYLRPDLLAPGSGSYELLSDSPLPQAPSPFDLSVFAAASADFEHVTFESTLALTPDATGGNGNLYESAGGEVRLVGRIPTSGAECDDLSASPCEPSPSSSAGFGALRTTYTSDTVSDDGSRIFFQAPVTPNDPGNAYVRIDGHRTVKLNASEKDSPASPQPAQFQTASADGTRAFFTTGESLVDADPGSEDLYMYDATEPAGQRLTRLSVDRNPGDLHSVSTVLGASADGRYVYFTDSGQLVAGEPILNGGLGLFVWHEGAIAYIGRFGLGIDIDLNGPKVPYVFFRLSNQARVTPDGRHLLFVARDAAGFAGRGGFPGYDHGNACTFGPFEKAACRELYLYSADTGTLDCVSCNPTSAPATANAFAQLRLGTGGSLTTSHLSRALSADGRWAFFSTAERLVEADTNSKSDAYAYDAATGVPHLLSSGTSDSDSYFLDARPDGRDAFILTRERLVGWDVDEAADLYDVRLDGGLPEPAAQPAPCAGDPCQGAPAAVPVSEGKATATFAGPGDPPVIRRCPKGTHRVKGRNGKSRCVKRRRPHHRQHSHKHHSRAANADRRAGR